MFTDQAPPAFPAAKERKERKDSLRLVASGAIWARPLEQAGPFFVYFVYFVVITARPIPLPTIPLPLIRVIPCYSVHSVVGQPAVFSMERQ